METKIKAMIIIGSVVAVITVVEAISNQLNNRLRAKTLIDLEKIDLQKQKLQTSEK